MVDDSFVRRDFAALYDLLNPPGPDTDFYLRIATEPTTILDIGCGTGTLSLALAAQGHKVTGVEPARGMLSTARDKDPEEIVEWIAADGCTFRTDTRFDLAVMTGHVFQVFLTDEETLAVLQNIKLHLKDGGRLAFESRNPLARLWQRWTEDQTSRQIITPDFGAVNVHYQLQTLDGEFVTFETVFTFIDRELTERTTSTLRFPGVAKISTLLQEAGFRRIDWLGDWDGSALSDSTPELIATAWT
jgi:SAM-dependent methyltransferase